MKFIGKFIWLAYIYVCAVCSLGWKLIQVFFEHLAKR